MFHPILSIEAASLCIAQHQDIFSSQSNHLLILPAWLFVFLLVFFHTFIHLLTWFHPFNLHSTSSCPYFLTQSISKLEVLLQDHPSRKYHRHLFLISHNYLKPNLNKIYLHCFIISFLFDIQVISLSLFFLNLLLCWLLYSFLLFKSLLIRWMLNVFLCSSFGHWREKCLLRMILK